MSFTLPDQNDDEIDVGRFVDYIRKEFWIGNSATTDQILKPIQDKGNNESLTIYDIIRGYELYQDEVNNIIFTKGMTGINAIRYATGVICNKVKPSKETEDFL